MVLQKEEISEKVLSVFFTVSLTVQQVSSNAELPLCQR